MKDAQIRDYFSRNRRASSGVYALYMSSAVDDFAKKKPNMGVSTHRVSSYVGFTLIEVLVALVIVAISLTAILKASSTDIKDTIRLRDVTIANWIAGNAIEKVQLGLIANSAGSSVTRQARMLDQNWSWTANINKTHNPLINRITVSVYNNSSNKKIVTLHGFVRGTTI